MTRNIGLTRRFRAVWIRGGTEVVANEPIAEPATNLADIAISRLALVRT